MKKLILSALISLFLTGCATSNAGKEMMDAMNADRIARQNVISGIKTADLGAELPKNYEKLAQDFIRATLKDPDSAKFSGMKSPIGNVFFDVRTKQYTYGYSICINVNAKNSYGGYTGNTPYGVFFRDGVPLYAYEFGLNLGVECKTL